MSWVQGWLEAEMAVASSHRRIVDLLDESGTGFADVVIADHYDDYRATLSGDPFPPKKWLRNLPTAHPARIQIRSYLGEIAHDIEFAATAEEYIVALRRDLSGGRSGGGRHWDWERFDPQKPGFTPEVDFGHRSEFHWRPGDPVNAPTSRGLKPLYEGGDAAGKPRYWNNLVYFEVRKAAADSSYEVPEFLREGYQGMHLIDESADGVLTAKPDPFRQMIETAKKDPDALPELVLEKIGGKPPKYQYAIDLPSGTGAVESKPMEIEHLIPQRAANDWADVMAAGTGEQLAATRQAMGLGPDAAVDFKREASSLFHQADSDYFYPVTREEHGSLDAFAKVRRSNRVDPGGDIPDGVTVRLGDSAEDTMTAAPSLETGGLGRSGRDTRVDRPMMYVPEKDLRQAARLLPAGMPPGLPVRMNDAGHVVSNAYEAIVQRIAVEIEARGLRGPEFELHPAFQHLYSEF